MYDVTTSIISELSRDYVLTRVQVSECYVLVYRVRINGRADTSNVLTVTEPEMDYHCTKLRSPVVLWVTYHLLALCLIFYIYFIFMNFTLEILFFSIEVRLNNSLKNFIIDTNLNIE